MTSVGDIDLLSARPACRRTATAKDVLNGAYDRTYIAVRVSCACRRASRGQIFGLTHAARPREHVAPPEPRPGGRLILWPADEDQPPAPAAAAERCRDRLAVGSRPKPTPQRLVRGLLMGDTIVRPMTAETRRGQPRCKPRSDGWPRPELPADHPVGTADRVGSSRIRANPFTRMTVDGHDPWR
jgi:hypothetical protein